MARPPNKNPVLLGYEPFGKTLKWFIDQIELSQSQFARELPGGTQTLINSWCQGHRYPTKSKLGDIAETLLKIANEKNLLIKKGSSLEGFTLVDIVNVLQFAANLEPLPYPKDIIWYSKVKGDKNIILGYVDCPPFASESQDARISLEIAFHILHWLDVDIKISNCGSWDKLTQNLLAREIDVIAPILFSNPKYMTEGIALSESIGLMMCHVVLVPNRLQDVLEHENGKLKLASFEKLEVIRLPGGTHELLYRQFDSKPRIKFMDASNYDPNKITEWLPELFISANPNRIPCLITASGTADDLIRKGVPCKKFYLPSEIDFPLALTFGVSTREEKLLEAINLALKYMKRSGALASIIKAKYSEEFMGDLLIERQVEFAKTLKKWFDKDCKVLC